MTVGHCRQTVMAIRMDGQGLTRAGRRTGWLGKDWGKGLGLGGEGLGQGEKLSLCGEGQRCRVTMELMA